MSTEFAATATRTPLPNSLIEVDAQGRAWIVGANTKVTDVVIDKIAWDWNPEQMQRQHPHLSLAQLHAALAYYYEHQAEVDAEIERTEHEFRRLRDEWRKTPAAGQLREKRQRPGA